jgi:hypothetical protein
LICFGKQLLDDGFLRQIAILWELRANGEERSSLGTGSNKEVTAMPGYVVLEHDHPEPHWDFMLEHAGVLKTWRLPVFPPVQGQKIQAQAIADHRLLYLNYEGPVSGNRGHVVRRDQGMYELLFDVASDQERPFAGSRLLLSLKGNRLCGRFALQRLHGNDWQFEFLGERAVGSQ